MNLFILRHGDAVARSTTDAQRPLSDRGVLEVQSVVEDMLDELKDIEIIFVSPLVRAQQTAAIVHNAIPNAVLQTTAALIPEADAEGVFALLQDCKQTNILLVSHQPLVGTLVNQLCGRDNYFHAMGTANLAFVQCEIAARNCGELIWLERPDV